MPLERQMPGLCREERSMIGMWTFNMDDPPSEKLASCTGSRQACPQQSHQKTQSQVLIRVAVAKQTLAAQIPRCPHWSKALPRKITLVSR